MQLTRCHGSRHFTGPPLTKLLVTCLTMLPKLILGYSSISQLRGGQGGHETQKHVTPPRTLLSGPEYGVSDLRLHFTGRRAKHGCDLWHIASEQKPRNSHHHARNVPGFARSIGRYLPLAFRKCLCARVFNVSRLTRLPAKVFISKLHTMLGVSQVRNPR